MPTDTFSIAAPEDDQQVYRQSSSVYPPNTSVSRYPSSHAPGRSISDNAHQVLCGLLQWDTSALPDNATIQSAVLRVVPTTIRNQNSRNLTADWYDWDGVSDSDHTNTAGTNAIAGIALSTFAVGTSKDITLANAPVNVNKNGYTKLRLHISGGAASIVSGNDAFNDIYFTDRSSGTSNVSQLIVTYDLLASDLVGAVGV